MTYVMSDIHGNRRRFDSIMEQINLQPTDKLYVIGDVIDRHADGINILLQLMDMPNATMLLGNHEYMMLDALDPSRDYDKFTRDWKIRLWRNNGCSPTLEVFRKLDNGAKARILDFLNSLPLTKTVIAGHKRYKLVHAAPPELFQRGYYTTVEEFAVWERLYYNAELPKGYTLVFGHTPTIDLVEKEERAERLKQGIWDDPDEKPRMMSIWYGDRRICLDCGSGFPDQFDESWGAIGRLACLRLDDGKEFYSVESFDPDECGG